MHMQQMIRLLFGTRAAFAVLTLLCARTMSLAPPALQRPNIRSHIFPHKQLLHKAATDEIQEKAPTSLKRATVVGGGPAGALMAIFLAQDRGFQVEIFEASSREMLSDRSERSYNIVFMERGLDALRAGGVDLKKEVQSVPFDSCDLHAIIPYFCLSSILVSCGWWSYVCPSAMCILALSHPTFRWF